MPPNDFERIGADNSVSEVKSETDAKAIAEAKAILEAEFDSLKARIKVERLCFLILLMIIFDSFVFQGFKNLGCPISILVLELVAIYLLGKAFEIDHVPELCDKIFVVATKVIPKKT